MAGAYLKVAVGLASSCFWTRVEKTNPRQLFFFGGVQRERKRENDKKCLKLEMKRVVSLEKGNSTQTGPKIRQITSKQQHLLVKTNSHTAILFLASACPTVNNPKEAGNAWASSKSIEATWWTTTKSALRWVALSGVLPCSSKESVTTYLFGRTGELERNTTTTLGYMVWWF